MQRAPRETDSCRRNRRPEDIERGHGDLETLSGISQALRRWNPTVFENKAGQRMRRHYFNPFCNLKSRRIRVNNKGGDSLRARGLAGSRKHQIEISDATVGDPCLLSVD